LYQEMEESEAQGMYDVKKLSKQRDNAADQAQINKTSKRVWASLWDVRHSPSGRPKYSSFKSMLVKV
jgi:hypothetical protein